MRRASIFAIELFCSSCFACGFLLAAALMAAGCHSSTTTTTPPPALGTATVAWAESNTGAAVCPAETSGGCLSGYTVLSDGAVVSADVPSSTHSLSWQTTVGTHAVQVFDNYIAPSGATVTVERLSVEITAQ